MTSLRERNRNRTRGDIESAALELFENQGYDATTVEQIAQRASVSSATFFRYYGSKEEVLFANEQDAVDEMIALVEQRSDTSPTLEALAEPVATFARNFLADKGSQTQRLTRLVMTTRELEARSMRMRLRWEHAIARQLASERGDEASGTDVLLANVAIACLSAALWQWQQPATVADIDEITKQMFDEARARLR